MVNAIGADVIKFDLDLFNGLLARILNSDSGGISSALTESKALGLSNFDKGVAV
jgi:hypothetical protein